MVEYFVERVYSAESHCPTELYSTIQRTALLRTRVWIKVYIRLIGKWVTYRELGDISVNGCIEGTYVRGLVRGLVRGICYRVYYRDLL